MRVTQNADKCALGLLEILISSIHDALVYFWSDHTSTKWSVVNLKLSIILYRAGYIFRLLYSPQNVTFFSRSK